jgi:hypothetical protein
MDVVTGLAKALVVAFAACGYPALPSTAVGDAAVGDAAGPEDATVSCPDCVLMTVQQPIAPADATIELEGTFGKPRWSHFPAA